MGGQKDTRLPYHSEFDTPVDLLVLFGIVGLERFIGTVSFLNDPTGSNTMSNEMGGNRLRPFQGKLKIAGGCPHIVCVSTDFYPNLRIVNYKTVPFCF